MSNILTELLKRQDQGLIRSQTDGRDLTIFNYTQECQFAKKWDKYTLMARGLILNKEGEIVARPFDKFFNLGEMEDPYNRLSYLVQKWGKPEINEKLDGSLGIAYWYYGQWNYATRGSFQSDQAIKMKELIHSKDMEQWANRYATHLFEIIFPENRIVVDYGDKEDLVYLGSRNNKTGQEYCDDAVVSKFTVPTKYEHVEDHRDNAEGYVIYFPSKKLRLKIKFEEYVRLHRIMTGITPKRIWNSLRSGDTIDLAGVPEEFSKDVEIYIAYLQRKYNKIVDAVEHIFANTQESMSRKEKAIYWGDVYPRARPMLFARLDGRPYDQMVWKRIKPTGDSIDLDDQYIPEMND